MGRGTYKGPRKRFAENLHKAWERGELEKNTPLKMNKIHKATGVHPTTAWGHIRDDLTKEELLERGETEPGILEINRELSKLKSPLEYRKVIVKEKQGILYGCYYGPLGRVRWPILPRQRAWRRTRPTPFLDRLEWRLNRPRRF